MQSKNKKNHLYRSLSRLIAAVIAPFYVAFAAPAIAQDNTPEKTAPDATTDSGGESGAHSWPIAPANGKPEHSNETIRKARLLSGVTTGVGLPVTVLAFFTGVFVDVPALHWTGLAAAHAVFAVGPSLGHYYLGHTKQATLTMLGRTVAGFGGSLLMIYGIAFGVFEGEDWKAGVGIAGGGVLWLTSIGLAVYDFVTLPCPSAGNAAKTSARKEDKAVKIAPTAWVGTNNGGIAVAGLF